MNRSQDEEREILIKGDEKSAKVIDHIPCVASLEPFAFECKEDKDLYFLGSKLSSSSFIESIASLCLHPKSPNESDILLVEAALALLMQGIESRGVHAVRLAHIQGSEWIDCMKISSIASINATVDVTKEAEIFLQNRERDKSSFFMEDVHESYAKFLSKIEDDIGMSLEKRLPAHLIAAELISLISEDIVRSISVLSFFSCVASSLAEGVAGEIGLHLYPLRQVRYEYKE